MARDLEELRRLLDRVTIVASATEETALIEALLSRDRPTVVSFINQNALNLAREDLRFRSDLCGADLLLRDGVGIEVALRLIGTDPGRNANGTDFIPRLLAGATGRRAALFGTCEPWLSLATERASALGCAVAASADGFEDEAVYEEIFQRVRPGIVVLGMGMPRQERVAAQLSRLADWPCLIINGGAVLDFWAGRFRRAPRWLQSARLEWMFRLAQEPRRLAPRYVGGGGHFALTVARLGWEARP